jgi:hypothetical protein
MLADHQRAILAMCLTGEVNSSRRRMPPESRLEVSLNKSWSERGGRLSRPGETMSATKSYEEIIDFIAAGTTPEAVVAFRPSESVQQRVAELVERSKDGSISAEDQSELEDFLQLEHIMIMAKARARQHTQLER